MGWDTYGVGSGLSVSDTSSHIMIYNNTFWQTLGRDAIQLIDCNDHCRVYNNLGDKAFTGGNDQQQNLRTSNGLATFAVPLPGTR
jgi:hypothetical protein